MASNPPLPRTMSTSYVQPASTPAIIVNGKPWTVGPHYGSISWKSENVHVKSMGLSSTGKGILIGMLSAFGSAAFVAIILAFI
ncbi:hypothetical protein KCU72_g20185, partial [Aureobasidium melanogenum]